MEIFSEIYNCYYQVLRHLLSSCDTITIQDIRNRIWDEGFEESLLSIIPKLEDGTWDLFERDGRLYRSKLSQGFTVPLSDLQKSYLKALLSDDRIGLFLNREQIDTLHSMLSSVPPLWSKEQFYSYDCFRDGDAYSDENYRTNFRTLLRAQKENRYVDIDYTAPNGNRVHHHYVPARLEYSVKNDRFRLLALKHTGNDKMELNILNLNRMQRVKLMDKTFSRSVDLSRLIRASYYKEPLKLRITNKRNALERAMLHFANYEKNTTKIDEDTYECLIYYNKNMETELLIEVLSFGPMITVLGNEKFLKSLKARLKKQKDLG